MYAQAKDFGSFSVICLWRRFEAPVKKGYATCISKNRMINHSSDEYFL
jgi:ligand-binding sensor domain-containing protein